MKKWQLLCIGMLLTMRGGNVSLLFMALNLLWAVVMTCRRKGWFKIIVLVLCIGIYRFYLGEDTK